MKKISGIFDKIIYFSILFFPILDIITSIMTYKGFSISLGLIVKFMLLVLMSISILFSKKSSKLCKFLISLFAVFVLINMANNYKFLVPRPNFEYAKLLVKLCYFVISTFFFTDFIKNQKYDLSILKTPIKIILITFMIALITGTSMPSYSNIYKVGFVGWFYSANELGGLLTLLFPVSIYLFFHHNSSKKYEYIYIVFHAVALLLLGTKVGLLGFMIVSILYVLYRIVFIRKYSYKNGLLLMLVTIVCSFVFWDILPCVKNTDEKYINVSNELAATPSVEQGGSNDDSELINEMIYSGRHENLESLKNAKEQIDSEINQNDNEKSNKYVNDYFGYMYMENGYFLLTERDFHDVLFFFGKIGLLFIIVSIVLPILINIKSLLKKVFDIKLFLLALSIMLVVAIAYISGHTLMSPMVGFYISVVLGFIASEKAEEMFSKKRLLISAVHMEYGGIERTLVNLLKNIDYKKYDIDLLLLLKGGPLSTDIPKKVNVIYPYNRLFEKIINNKNIFCKILKHLMFNKYTAFLYTTNYTYDVAIDYAGYYNFITSYTINSKAKRKFIWVHNQPRFIINKTFKYKFFNKIIFVSNSNKEEMEKLYPKYKNKYEVMYNLLEKPIKNSEKINWNNTKLKGLAIGRLCSQKRFDKLIKCARLLKDKKIDFEIKIIGDGPQENELKQLIKENQLQNNVYLIGSKSNVGNYLESADFYVMTSDYEGLPTVVLEALAFDLTIIGLSIPPLEEIKENIAAKDTIVLANDLNQLADCIEGFKKQKNKSFDLKKYNRNNIKKFEELCDN